MAQIDELVLTFSEQPILAMWRVMVVPIGKLSMELLVETFTIAIDECFDAAEALQQIPRLSQVSWYHTGGRLFRRCRSFSEASSRHYRPHREVLPPFSPLENLFPPQERYSKDGVAQNSAHSPLPWGQLTRRRFDRRLSTSFPAMQQCHLSKIQDRQWDLYLEETDSPLVILRRSTLDLVFYAYSGPVDDLEAFFAPLALLSLNRIDSEFDPAGRQKHCPTEVFSPRTAHRTSRPGVQFDSIRRRRLIALSQKGASLSRPLTFNFAGSVWTTSFRLYRDDDFTPIALKLEDIYLFGAEDFNEGPMEEARCALDDRTKSSPEGCTTLTPFLALAYTVTQAKTFAYILSTMIVLPSEV
ncbi:hypothetical protein K438DRAFT_2094328 [Mycena galopus ATCC 62051]|nr:hypothetical protein K438DRAFT_2094328 [Mycena galopus ATCC 62051]